MPPIFVSIWMWFFAVCQNCAIFAKEYVSKDLNTKYYVFRYCRGICYRAQVGA